MAGIIKMRSHIAIPLAIIAFATTVLSTSNSTAATPDLSLAFGGSSPLFAHRKPEKFDEIKKNLKLDPKFTYQNRILLIRNKIRKIIANCGCGLNQNENAILSIVSNQLQTSESGAIYFADEDGSLNPNIPEGNRRELEHQGFKFDDHLFRTTHGGIDSRVAVTQLKPSAIIFNNDRISELNDLRSIVGIIIHELGHQTGIPDTDDRVLDQLASKVQRRFDSDLETLDSHLEGSDLRLQSISMNSDTSNIKSHVWFSDQFLDFDLNPILRESVFKFDFAPHISDVKFGNFRLRNVYDTSLNSKILFYEGTASFTLSDNAESSSGKELHIIGDQILLIPIQNLDGNWIYQGDPITTRMDRLVQPSRINNKVFSIDKITVGKSYFDTIGGKQAEIIPINLKLGSANPIISGMITLKSESFSRETEIPILRLDVESTDVTLGTDNLVEMTFKITLPEGVPEKEFFIDKVIVGFDGEEAPAVSHPKFHTRFRSTQKVNLTPIQNQGAAVYSVLMSSPLDPNIVQHEIGEFVPVDLFLPENELKFSVVQFDIDTIDETVKGEAIIDIIQEDYFSSKTITRPMIIPLRENAMGLRGVNVEKTDSGEKIQIEIYPSRLPIGTKSFRFRKMNLVNRRLQEAQFNFEPYKN